MKFKHCYHLWYCYLTCCINYTICRYWDWYSWVCRLHTILYNEIMNSCTNTDSWSISKYVIWSIYWYLWSTSKSNGESSRCVAIRCNWTAIRTIDNNLYNCILLQWNGNNLSLPSNPNSTSTKRNSFIIVLRIWFGNINTLHKYVIRLE